MKNDYNNHYSLCKFCKLANSASYDCIDCVGDCTLWEPSGLFRQELAKHGYKLTENVVRNAEGEKVQDSPIKKPNDCVKTLILICLPGCGQEEFVASLKNTKYKISYYDDVSLNSICMRIRADINDEYDIVLVETSEHGIRQAIHDDLYIMENSKIYAYHPCVDAIDRWIESSEKHYTEKYFKPIRENVKKWVEDIISECLFFSIEHVCEYGDMAFSLYQTGIPSEKYQDIHHIHCEWKKIKTYE